MSSLSILHLLLLLLAFHTPSVWGASIMLRDEQYFAAIKEIRQDLKNLTVSSNDSLLSDEQMTLQDKSLLRSNLDAFVTAAKNLLREDSSIIKNLESFQSIPLTTTCMEDPIVIENSLGDFQNKLMTYLVSLENFLKSSLPTGTSHHRPSGC